MRIAAVSLSIVFLLAHVSSATPATQPVVISIDPAASDAFPIPADFLGVSIETSAILPEADGMYRYSPDDKPLVQMFKTLGIKSLRIGGNSADNSKVAIPDEKAIDAVFQFAQAAGVKVIYTLRLKPPIDVAAEAATAKHIADQYLPDLEAIELGNEPNFFDKHFDDFVNQWLTLHDAIDKLGVTASFCGPSVAAGGNGSWQTKMATDPRFAGKVDLITFHAYPGGNGEAVKKDPAAARDKLLGPDMETQYQKRYDSCVPDIRAAGHAYRISETNSLYNAGGEDVSDTFASALWGLQYLHWWAEHAAAGINFHTGDQTAAGAKMRPSYYALFWKQGDGFNAHPMAYACKAFDLGGVGKQISLKLDGLPDTFRAHAILRDDGSVAVTLINLAHGDGAAAVDCDIVCPKKSVADAYVLNAPKGDVAAKTGILLGGNSVETGGAIHPNGLWDGKPFGLRNDREGEWSIRVAPASAAVVILKK